MIIYTIQAEGDYFVALAVNLPGCMATGDTPVEALEALLEAEAAYKEFFSD